MQRNYDLLPKSGSELWTENRKYTFGGSEAAAILGHSKYRSKDDVLTSKLEPRKPRTVWCWWGHVFEPIAKMMIEEKYGTIYNFGSIPSSTIPMCYLPDGIFIKNNKLVLLEVKCPVMRKICGCGSCISSCIKPDYVWQVQAGLMALPVKSALFADFQFRKSSIRYFKTNFHDMDFHKCWNRRPVLKRGYVAFKNRNGDNTETVDLGSMQPGELNELCRTLWVDHFKFVDADFEDWPKCYILPFKLYGLNEVWIEPDLNMQNELEEKIWKVAEELELIQSQPKKPESFKTLKCLKGYHIGTAKYSKTEDSETWLFKRSKKSMCQVHGRSHMKFGGYLKKIYGQDKWIYHCCLGGSIDAI